MKTFNLKIDQAELALIVRHLNKGVYEDVAQFLNNVHQQIEKQLPKAKLPKSADPRVAATPKVNGTSRYAKGP